MRARAVEGDGGGAIPIEPIQHGALRAVRTGLAVALAARGLDPRRYELGSALAIALRTPDAASRYLEGERLFEPAATPADGSGAALVATCEAFIARDPSLSR